MKYKSALVTKRGGLDAVKMVERELVLPAVGEVRVKILASPVCQDDVAVRIGNRPFAKKPPFVPGYSILGTVDAIGEDVTGFEIGQRVVALTNFGGHAEYIYWEADQLMPVPEDLNPAEAVVLILNYLVAYQILHRVAKVKEGDKVLLIGASGGVGTAFLQLGKLTGLKMYGLASPSKNHILKEYGATPIDYHSQDFVEVFNEAEPDGLDFVFNGMGEETFERSMKVLKRGGKIIHYGGPESTANLVKLVGKLIFYNLMPNGKQIVGYGTHRLGVNLFKEDWAKLFELLAAGEIKPIIAAKFPILDFVKAYEMLERGKVVGNIVLLAPELL